MFGMAYFFSNEFMPYHRDAVQLDWEDVNKNTQVLILALMKIVGIASISVCILSTYLLLNLFKYDDGAIYILPLSLLNVSIVTFWVMSKVNKETGAKPPRKIVVISSILCISGFCFSLM
jgi:hypothetical protein